MRPFVLERYFAAHEFTAPYLMCCSDVQALSLAELLAVADEEGLQWWEQLTLGYTDYPGDSRLRREIAGLYDGLQLEEIYCFGGAQEAIYLLFKVLLDESAHAIVTWPGYQSLYEVAEDCGAQVSLLELHESEGWQLNLDRLRQLWRPETRLVVINFPHNPTGAVLPPQVLRELIGLCEERGAWLFSDEVYHGLDPEGASAAVELSPRAISLGVMSKSFGLAGLRIGWLACRDPQILRAVAALKDYTTICNAAPSEALAFIGLRAKHRLWERAGQIVNGNIALFQALVDELPDLLGWVAPRGGTMGFPRLKLEIEVAQFAERLRQETGVLILPGSVYDYPGPNFRVGLGRRNFPEVLERLRAFLLKVSPREVEKSV